MNLSDSTELVTYLAEDAYHQDIPNRPEERDDGYEVVSKPAV